MMPGRALTPRLGATVGDVILLSLTASLNPTLVAVTTVMLLLDKPARLMAGYLLGAYLTSITLGLVIVFALSSSGAKNTTENTVSPAVDIGLGAVALAVAFVLYTGRAERLRERRRARKAANGKNEPPRWQRQLSKGSPRTTFAVGALLTLPGASYLAGLDEIHKLKASTAVTVLLVIAEPCDVAIAEDVLAAARTVETSQEVEHGALARARGPHDGDVFAGVEVDRDAP